MYAPENELHNISPDVMITVNADRVIVVQFCSSLGMCCVSVGVPFGAPPSPLGAPIPKKRAHLDPGSPKMP